MAGVIFKVGDYFKLREGIELHGVTQGKVYEVIGIDYERFYFINDYGRRDFYFMPAYSFELAEDFILKELWKV